MDVNLANLRLEGDQAGVFSGFSIKFLATIQPLIQVLGNLLQLKCQNSDTAPFQTHGTIMSLVIAAVCVYFVAFMEITRPVRNTSLFKQTFNRTRRAEASPQASNDNPVGQEAGDDGAHQAEAGPRATNANFMKQEGGDHGPIEICV
ncbi:uncharacterized protein LOC122305719 isoform X3 [Carya illinoinensis]|uniref:Uncharacterized protein n=1 Tax=Carya illinoinensis TaxID=32201 RepID=A0A922JXV9_CARIL|nr:uncharacterized protein LOC122305719 isoform X3 [Carya illinoinensis]KAG6720247.1 hypothetical protein I3842_03G049700 [Carya illinoinensis]